MKNLNKKIGAVALASMVLFGGFAAGGAQSVEKYLSIDDLSSKTASDALIAITDFVCPDGGPQDEGIARAAYISAIEESPEMVTIKFKDMSSEQIMLIVERTMTNAIFNRITKNQKHYQPKPK